LLDHVNGNTCKVARLSSPSRHKLLGQVCGTPTLRPSTAINSVHLTKKSFLAIAQLRCEETTAEIIDKPDDYKKSN